MSGPRILVVDDDESLVDSLSGLLEHAGYTVRSASTSAAAIHEVGTHPTDLVLLDLRLGEDSGLDLLPRLSALRPEMSIVMITALGRVEDAVEAMRRGADNFILKPLDPPSLLAVLAKGLESRELRHRSLRLERLHEQREMSICAESASMRETLALIEKVAPRDTTVLLLGETGTGKGLLARRIHDLSARRKQAFVELNCAGLQPELTESELFGHEKGAFTSAVERKLGLFEAAHGGTLFLDEIGEMDAGVQAKLLKVLEEGRFRRLGGVTEIATDVRVLAATHRDLARSVAEGSFREDLYYRLNVFEVPIAPLRERRDDIVPLALLFLGDATRPGVPRKGISPDARVALRAYHWPGNVRELHNVIERAAIVCGEECEIGVAHLPELTSMSASPVEAPPSATIESAERQAIERALSESRGNILSAARQLGISRGTLYRKIKKFGIAQG